MTLTLWLSITVVLLGAILLVLLWRMWRLIAQLEEATRRATKAEQRREEQVEARDDAIKSLRKDLYDARTRPLTLEDHDESLHVVVDSIHPFGSLHSGGARCTGHLRGLGRVSVRAEFRITGDRSHEAILAARDARDFVVPIEDVTKIERSA